MLCHLMLFYGVYVEYINICMQSITDIEYSVFINIANYIYVCVGSQKKPNKKLRNLSFILIQIKPTIILDRLEYNILNPNQYGVTK